MPRLLTCSIFIGLCVAACGESRPDFCDGGQSGVQVNLNGVPSSATSIEVVVQDNPDARPCEMLVWDMTPTGLSEDRRTGAPGDVLSSTVDVDRYDRLSILGYALENGTASHGACIVVEAPYTSDTICQELTLAARP